MVEDTPIVTKNKAEIAKESIMLEKSKLSSVKIYPNPFKDVLYIEYDSEEEAVKMVLLNTIGIKTYISSFMPLKKPINLP